MLDSPVEAAQGHKTQKKDLTGLRILLADDAIDNQKIVRFLLAKAGAHVEVAEDGALAVQKAGAQPFDVVLMDMEMPEMDGYQATRLLRQRGFTMPILALTAHSRSQDLERCLKAGCNDCLTKPVDPARLIQIIAPYIGQRTTNEQTSISCAFPPSSDISQVIESEFADEADLAEIIDQFVAGLPDKVESIQQAMTAGDYERLSRLAHQLKGAGGSYGYPALTRAAKTLEDAAKGQDAQIAGQAFGPLSKLCRTIVAGHRAQTLSDGG